MAYNIDNYNGAPLTVVEDGTIDQTTDLKLVGKNYAGYGEIQNENFVFLLENFAGGNKPPKALSGQAWFDTVNSKFKFYDGSKWRTAGGSEIGGQAPAGLTIGDFWWDTTNEQLYAYNGNEWILIGPQGAGEGVTQFQSRTIQDIGGNNRYVIASVVNDEIIHIISGSEDFTIGEQDRAKYIGFDKIHRGLTLKNTENVTGGVTSTDHRWWGTASNSERLGGQTFDKFVQFGENLTFSSQVGFGDTGIAIGDNGALRLRIINDNQAVIGNEIGYDVFFQVRDTDNTIRMPLRLTHDKVLPGYQIVISPASDSYSLDAAGVRIVDIGSSTASFQNIYADRFIGKADKADQLEVSYLTEGSTLQTGYFTATTSATTGVSICARDITGDIRANVFRGTATAAQYADLAEMYLSDVEYEPGTVLVIGGEAEVTQSTSDFDHKVVGVVSTNPAHVMNSELEGCTVAVALRGRVPCKVVGPVSKGDLLVTSVVSGTAKAANDLENISDFCIIGKSLEDFSSDSVGIVEIIV